ERRPTMPLHVPAAPAPALRSVLTALSSPTAVREARTPSLLGAPRPLSAELPLPVHVLDGITAGGGSATRLAGWRSLIRSGEHAVAAPATVPTPRGWAVSRFLEGPSVAATELALRQAEPTAGPYQPPLLSVAELSALAPSARTPPPARRRRRTCSCPWPRRRPGSRRTAPTGRPTGCRC